ncbi:putative 26S proteasome regulatory subunit [Sorochytrium milnesiophthora]
MSSSSSAQAAYMRQRTQALVKEKDDIEEELREMEGVLKSQNVGLDEPLVDRDGFPRADVDVYNVRIVRSKIVRRRNDLKDVMKRIEASLHDLHQATQEALSRGESIDIRDAATSNSPRPTPFARVDAVAPDSPAKEAGLLKDDLILQFGSVSNNSGSDVGGLMKELLGLVASHENKQVKVVVQRVREQAQTTYDTLELTMTPRKWPGRAAAPCPPPAALHCAPCPPPANDCAPTQVFHQVVDELHGCFTGHESSGAHIDLSQALHGFIDHSPACHDASASFSGHVDAHFDASASLHAHVFVGHC